MNGSGSEAGAPSGKNNPPRDCKSDATDGTHYVDAVTDGGAPVERFTHANLSCKIVETDAGHWCGYVRRPEDAEPTRWTSDYDSKHDEILDAEVDVWGGITYGPDEDGWVGFDDGHSRSIVHHREADNARAAVRLETKWLAEQIQELGEKSQPLADGGLDAETVLGSVAPGDVVEVASRPCRVVDVDGDVLRLYDLVERSETLKAASAGDVDQYVHRSEEDVIDTHVREERELREDDVDEGEGVETDGGVTVYDCDNCGEVLQCNVDDAG